MTNPVYTPTTCKSRHHNPGNDICEDCGFPLQFDGSEAAFEALSAEDQATWTNPSEDDEENEVEYLRSPFGVEIVSTLEIIPGTCDGEYEDGEFHHLGETDVGWDGQETVVRAGQRVFLDAYGKEFLESELVKPGESLPVAPVSPWADPQMIALLLREKWDEVMEIIMGEHYPPEPNVPEKGTIEHMIQTMARQAAALRNAKVA